MHNSTINVHLMMISCRTPQQIIIYISQLSGGWS
uniref:Uncharacterized protein n=1 Tax=Arundo donax TaxID=35708 RepID=A0A0A8Z5E4_ARUDO